MKRDVKDILIPPFEIDDLTEWRLERPNIPGPYITKVFGKGSPPGYAYWTGEYWGPNYSKIEDALSDVGRSQYQEKIWCGLKTKPMKSTK